MPAERLVVTMVSVTKTVRFRLVGDLTVGTLDRLSNELGKVPAEMAVVLDMSEVGHVDLHGLWVLVADASRHANGDSSLRLEGLSAEARLLLESTGTAELIVEPPTSDVPS